MNNQTTKVKSKNKGAVVVLALALIVASVSNPITAEANVSTLTGYMWLFFSVYFGLSYKSDCYRKFVLKENFWI